MNDDTSSPGPLAFLRRAIYSLNFAFALGLLTSFILTRVPTGFIHGVADHPSGFVKVAVAINTLFSLPGWAPLGMSVTLMLITSVFFGLLLLAFHSRVHTGKGSRASTAVSGFIALFAVPLTWLVRPPYAYYGFRIDNALTVCAALELSVLAGTLFLTRNSSRAVWLICVLAHYCLWGWTLVGIGNPHFGAEPFGVFPLWFSLVSPAAGFTWVISRTSH